MRCPGCENLHLIADRLGIFEGGDWDIQKAVSQLGENVNVVNNDNVLELSLEELVGKDAIENLSKGIPADANDDAEEDKK